MRAHGSCTGTITYRLRCITRFDVRHLVISIGISMREYLLDCRVVTSCSCAVVSGFAIVMAENPAGVRQHLGVIPGEHL